MKPLNPSEDIQVRRLIAAFDYCLHRSNRARLSGDDREADRYLVECARCSRDLDELMNNRLNGQSITINQTFNLKEVHIHEK